MSLSQVQQLSVKALQMVASGQNLDKVLSEVVQGVTLIPEEHSALKDISYGCQRYLGELKHYLHSLVSKPVNSSAVEGLLLVGLYQLAYTQTPTHVVVNEAVNAVNQLVGEQFKGLVNGVLRNFLRKKADLQKSASQDIEAKYNHPKWFIEKVKKEYPKHWHNILIANQKHPPMTLRVNCRQADAQSYLLKLEEAGISGKALDEFAIKLAKPVSVRSLPQFSSGMVSVQDYGAQKAALLLQPKNGERVLDACAAPGGKACHILELTDCVLTALDIDSSRLQKVSENLSRLNFAAELKCADASDLSGWYNGEPFDAILADVPCSASGVIKRHPDIKWLRQIKDADKIARQQTILLDQLWNTLKFNGRMLLATCSIFSEENQKQTERFLLRHLDAKLVFEECLLPCEQNDGFYYALLQKN